MSEIKMQLRGGLGNQLFQVTAMNFFTRKLSCQASLDDVAIIKHLDKSRRSWLRNFDIQWMFNNSDLKWENRVLTRIRAELPPFQSSVPVLNEEALTSLIKIETKIRVVGWFYSKHFLPKGKRKLERSALSNISKSVLDFGDYVRGENIGAIHIRLGDFKQTTWGILSETWYQRAAATLIGQGIKKLDCFSDDIDEAKRIMREFNTKIKIEYPEEDSALNPIELLWSLASYKSYASGNSSLSWWSSYLNRNRNNFIICPWEDHLLMPDWHKI